VTKRSKQWVAYPNSLMPNDLLVCVECLHQLSRLPGDVLYHVCPIGKDSLMGREDRS
jgi:hypothetical protein